MYTRRKRGRCPVCGEPNAACGGPGPDPSVIHEGEGVTHMSNGKLSVYEVIVNGRFKTKMQLTEAEARRRGLIVDGQEAAPAEEPTPAPAEGPAPKATSKKTTKQEGDE